MLGNLDLAGDSQQEFIPQLPIYQSTQSRSVNLNELIKLHRIRQKYEIVDKFFNNSYISIENKLQPIQVYYQYDMFRSYLQDLNMVYFKDIEFSQNVRLQYVLRRLNFTLNGENYNFRQFLVQNKFYQDVLRLFSEQFLQGIEITSNQSKIIDLRNTLNLCLILKYLHSYNFSEEQRDQISAKITKLYKDIKNKVHPINQVQQSEDEGLVNHQNCPIKSATNQSQKSRQRQDDQENQSHLLKYLRQNIQNNTANNEGDEQEMVDNEINYYFDDMLYEEEICLKIIQIELQNSYFLNQINDPNTNEEHIIKLKYLCEINKQYIDGLKDLKQLNDHNRFIVKKIQRNLKIQLNTGIKCIVIDDSNNLQQCFGRLIKIDQASQQQELNYQKLLDAQCMQKLLFGVINRLKMRQIADAIQKVYEIQKDESRYSKLGGGLVFSVSFQKGLGINEVTFNEKDFLTLNQLRQQSTLTSYLTPMKSCHSYISHNIYTFLKLVDHDFPYDKSTNNNDEVMKRIRNKISRHRNLGKTDLKQLYYTNFRVCHNCKILCHKNFLKQCRRRAKHQRSKSDDDEQQIDDSLYTERNFRSKKHSGQYVVECEKNYCIYCIKNQFNGKIFNEKGWCPSCLDSCHCNTCLRERMVKKLIDLYLFVGGDPLNIKTEKQIIQGMRIKLEDSGIEEISQQQSLNYSQIDQKIYESVIKKQIIKGYSAEQIQISIKQQKEVIGLLVERQNIKFKSIVLQMQILRQKISHFNINFQHLDSQVQQQKRRFQIDRKVRRLKQKQQSDEKNRQRYKRLKRSLSKSDERRKCKRIVREQQIYYDYYKFDNSDSYSQSSSFHIKQKKSREKKYEPQYTF